MTSSVVLTRTLYNILFDILKRKNVETFYDVETLSIDRVFSAIFWVRLSQAI